MMRTVVEKILAWMLLCAGCLSSGFAFSFPTQNDNTPGRMALNYTRSASFWARYDLALVDASVTTSPPDNVRADRRIQNLAIVGSDLVINQRLGLRLNFQGENEIRRQREQSPPQAVTDSKSSKLFPSADLTFITQAGLEVFGGVGILYVPTQEEESVASAISSKTTYDSTYLVSPRMGVVRRGGIWNGGMYYVFGKESNRNYNRVASDGSELNGKDVVHDPPTIAIYGNFGAKGKQLEFELASVQAGSGGNRTDTGTPVKEDYIRINFGGVYSLGPLGLRSSIAHQTLSYSHSAYVDVESIPFTSVRTYLNLGSESNYLYGGIIYGRGSDTQSIPEFNAKYNIEAYAISGGMFLNF